MPPLFSSIFSEKVTVGFSRMVSELGSSKSLKIVLTF